MAKWKEIPLGKRREVPSVLPKRWAYNPTAAQMETLLDAVFYKVIGRVPVTKYEENEGSGIIEADE